MQNEHFPIVPHNPAAEEPQGVMSMSEMLHMSFDQLWESSESHSRMAMGQESLAVGGGGANVFYGRPHVNFTAIHALQGTSHPAGAGMFDLMPHNHGRVTRGVHPQILRHLQTKVIDSTAAGIECHVCMEPFKQGARVALLPCEHFFCVHCIQEWLKKNDTCPVCRYKFPEHQTYLTNHHE